MGLGSHTQISDRAMAHLLDTAVAEACTGRATGGTGNPTRLALIPLGGVA
ncbi:hypothetical protein QF036_001261 [Arthrobacter globiformis]|nr:hypothetical protein [Arthrobacter globiformis]